MLGGVSDAIKILVRSSLFKKLTLCMMLTGMVSEAMQDLLLQYLQIKLGFGVKDQVRVREEMGGRAAVGDPVQSLSILKRRSCLSAGAPLDGESFEQPS